MPARTAYRQLQAIRDRLPTWQPHSRSPQLAENILALANSYDVYWFDAFGVLNVGPQPIPGAVEAVAALRQRSKQVFVLSNAASVSKPNMVTRFATLGFDFAADEIVTSRDAVLDALADYPRDFLWGLIGLEHSQEDLDARGVRYLPQSAPDFYSAPDGFLFLATANWDDTQQQRFVEALAARPRPVILGNPDLIAPMPEHTSIEPGSYVLTLPDEHFAHVHVCGKPYPAIFAHAARRLAHFDPARTLMCGDTLHTDILGGNAFGVRTALITAHGFYRDLNYHDFIGDSGIVPDHILPRL